MSIEKFTKDKVWVNVVKKSNTTDVMLVDFLNHPWFQVINEYLTRNIELLTQEMLADNPANDKVLFTANTVNRNLRNFIIWLQNEPIRIAQEMQMLENLEQWEFDNTQLY